MLIITLREAQLVGVGLTIVLLHACFFSICVAKDGTYQRGCRPSSCGNIHNISYPFRLQGDPSSCGYPEYELICENNRTVVKVEGEKYYVADIRYEDYVIRVVDPEPKEGSCLVSSPLHSLVSYDNGFPYSVPYRPASHYSGLSQEPIYYTIILMECDRAIRQDYYVPIVPCKHSMITADSTPSPTYDYAVLGDYVSARDIPYSCTIGTSMLIQPLKRLSNPRDLSMSDLQDFLLVGLELSFFRYFCDRECQMKGKYCEILHENVFQCYAENEFVLDTTEKNWFWKFIRFNFLEPLLRGSILPQTFKIKGLRYQLGVCQRHNPCYILMIGGWVLRIIVIVRTPPGMLCLIAYLVYKFHRRHLSSDDNIEEFLQSHRNLLLIKYSYSDIKKMTHNFANKLGQGGFGSVYQGKLQSGNIVAVKMLSMSKSNGRDFINEVATIGRIHHVNIVRLVGFCVQGSKWAIIYDFMPNGSLDKFIFGKEESNSILSWEKLYKIALGVGRGIEYLHQGCDMQILHFDIKPHNILLDEDFTPKISDFGLAKLCSMNESIVSLTAARGTLGYIAPELFYKNIGGVSIKADVYSYGMLLLEMVGRRRNMNANAEHSSQIYFPSWIYDKYDQGENIDLEGATEDEKMCIRKMVIVSLWCIQMKPIDRPSMSKVLEMLEGEAELLEMPPKPSLYSDEMSARAHVRNPSGPPISSCNSIGTITLDGR